MSEEEEPVGVHTPESDQLAMLEGVRLHDRRLRLEDLRDWARLVCMATTSLSLALASVVYTLSTLGVLR